MKYLTVICSYINLYSIIILVYSAIQLIITILIRA